MKLHMRLALPLFAAAAAVALAGTLGVIFLQRAVFEVAMREQGSRLGEIADNVLRGRTKAMSALVSSAGSFPASFRSRVRALRTTTRLDLAVVVSSSGTASPVFGPSPDAADARAVRPLAPPPILVRAGDALFVCGAIAGEGGKVLFVGQRLDDNFVRALGELLRVGVDLEAGGKTLASSAVEGTSRDTRPVRFALRTTGGSSAGLVVHMPVEVMVRARGRAILWTLAGAVVLLALAMVFYWYVVVRVTGPIRDLTAVAGRIGAGDLKARMPGDAPAELGELAAQMNAMAASLEEARERLVRSAQLASVGEMVSGISHELNNPLTGLLGQAEYLATKLHEGEQGREELDIIIAEGKRMKRVLAQLRGLVRPADEEKADMDLNQSVRDLFAIVRHDATRAGVACETRLTPAPVMVRAVPDQVRQVLLNLAVNAIQSMGKGGKLVVETRVDAGEPAMARVSVSDTGHGIGADIVARLFDPFFSTKRGSLGLGLAISREIAVRHGGTIDVASEPGKGTTMTLSLPAA